MPTRCLLTAGQLTGVRVGLVGQPDLLEQLEASFASSVSRFALGVDGAFGHVLEGEATLRVASPDGRSVSVRPGVFHHVIEAIAVHGWHVEQNDNGVTVRIIDPDHHVDDKRLARDVRVGLMDAGVSADVTAIVERVPKLARSALGKTPLILGRRDSVR